MTLTVDSITDNVFHVKAESQYELTSTFMRLQEFYESPYKEIRGHFFTHEKFMDVSAHNKDRSAQDEIIFSYMEDWAGFNVPGNCFQRWCKLFEHDFWEKEKKLVELVNKARGKSKRFYVIGTYEDTTIDHELSHAWFYLDRRYRTKMLAITNTLSDKAKKRLHDYIIADGYRRGVVEDETVAYLSTNTMVANAKMFGSIYIPWTTIFKLQKTFKKFKDEKIDDDN